MTGFFAGIGFLAKMSKGKFFFSCFVGVAEELAPEELVTEELEESSA